MTLVLPAPTAGISVVRLSDQISAVRKRIVVAGCSPETATQYTEEAERYVRWFTDRTGSEPTLGDFAVDVVDDYILALEDAALERDRPWSSATKGNVASDIRGFGKYLAQSLGWPMNPMATLASRRKRVRRRAPAGALPFEGDALDDDEVAALLGALDPAHPYDVGTRAAIALGLEDGPRTSELARLNVEDLVDVEYRGLGSIGPGVRILLPAKTSPMRMLPLGVWAEDYLRVSIGARTSGPLFAGRFGQRMTPDALRTRVSHAGERVGLDIDPQRLRRSAAANQSAHGAWPAQVNAVLGWQPDARDVPSFHYTRPRLDQIFHAHQTRLSPLDRADLRLREAGKPGLPR